MLGRYCRSGTLAKRSTLGDVTVFIKGTRSNTWTQRLVSKALGSPARGRARAGWVPLCFPKGQARRTQLMLWKVSHVGTRALNAHPLPPPNLSFSPSAG